MHPRDQVHATVIVVEREPRTEGTQEVDELGTYEIWRERMMDFLGVVDCGRLAKMEFLATKMCLRSIKMAFRTFVLGRWHHFSFKILLFNWYFLH